MSRLDVEVIKGLLCFIITTQSTSEFIHGFFGWMVFLYGLSCLWIIINELRTKRKKA